MKTVILAEKPSQASAYAESFQRAVKKSGYYQIFDPLFTGDVVITYGFGHLVELVPPEAYSKKWARWSLENLPIFPNQYRYQVPADKQKQFQIVKRELKSADTIVIATDADREGELIAWSIIKEAGAENRKKIQRLWINSLEKDVIYRGFQHLRPAQDFYPKYQEAQTRQIADWLIGMNGSPLYSLLLQKRGIAGVFSLGRVQTPTLYLIYQLQKEIEQFKKEPYFEVLGTVKADGGKFNGKLQPNRTFKTAAELMAYVETHGAKLAVQPGKILQVTTNEKASVSPRLFSLSSLQTRMNRLMKASAKATLAAVQDLYEAKLLSYPRTDSVYITENEHRYLVGHLADYKAFLKVEDVPTPQQQPKSRYVDAKKVQEHHAIIPTKKIATAQQLAKMSRLQRAIYDQVLRVTVAMFAEAYTYDETVILTAVQQLQLKTVGKTPKNRGWQAIVKQAEVKEAPPLPQVVPNETVQVKLTAEAKETQPPKPYTEGTLITAMKTAGKTIDNEQAQAILKEVEGIGTEATRANIIETLKQKEYIIVEKNNLIVTEKGKLFCKAVEPERLLTSAEMTASWETYLKKIGQKTGSPEHFLANIQKFILHLIQQVPAELEQVELKVNPANTMSSSQAIGTMLGRCPKCQQGQVQLYSKVAACTNPACDFKLWPTIAKKKLTPNQLKELITKRKTSRLLRGFSGKKGKFAAYVVLKEDFTTGFEFPSKTSS